MGLHVPWSCIGSSLCCVLHSTSLSASRLEATAGSPAPHLYSGLAYTAQVPTAVHVDVELIRRAPRMHNLAGLGRVLALHTAHFDWNLADAALKEDMSPLFLVLVLLLLLLLLRAAHPTCCLFHYVGCVGRDEKGVCSAITLSSEASCAVCVVPPDSTASSTG